MALAPALMASPSFSDAEPAACNAFLAPGRLTGVRISPPIRPASKTFESSAMPSPSFKSLMDSSRSAVVETLPACIRAENSRRASSPTICRRAHAPGAAYVGASAASCAPVANALAPMSATPPMALIMPAPAPAIAGFAPSVAMVFNTSVTPTSFPADFCFFSDSWMRLLACSAAPQVTSTNLSQAPLAAFFRSKSETASLMRSSVPRSD